MDDNLVYLRELSKLYPSADAALAETARLRARLTLPKETVHVISDVHGEFKKLKHVINNASGSLRMLVDECFTETLSEDDKNRLLSLLYYPRESFLLLQKDKQVAGEELSYWLGLEVQLLRRLIRRHRLERVERVVPQHFWPVFREMLLSDDSDRIEAYLSTFIDTFQAEGRAVDLLRIFARVVRNLLVTEVIVAGDLGDRGPRMDLVLEYLMRQPSVRFTWGNHDGHWMGACLGHAACVASVVRVSLRYSNSAQLEEGYGIPLAPLERLANELYGDDPASRFACKGDSVRDPLTMARMQKAIAMLQFKLEGSLIDRNPHFEMEDRRLLHRIDLKKGTLALDGGEHQLLDTDLPTLSADDPYALTPEEEACIEAIRSSFLRSPQLWRHMKFLARRGSMYLVRDDHLIFHACVPVDANGEFLSFPVSGSDHSGKDLFDELERVVARVFRRPNDADLDLLWYLWAGPRSPWFGKDKMATFENYFIEDKDAQKETKNPYFSLIHEKPFCEKVLAEFGVDPENGLIVNGHVPVKIEKGESPVKRSGKAVTIDGAFSEAYGDYGFTLILDSSGTYLAQHHHFGSVEQAITAGSDIIPSIEELKRYPSTRTLSETEAGEDIRKRLELLESLIEAYRENRVSERPELQWTVNSQPGPNV